MPNEETLAGSIHVLQTTYKNPVSVWLRTATVA
jgi:hypothetical protein